MKKKKDNWWKRQPYWLKGGIIGFLFGLFPINEIFTSMFVTINDLILSIPRGVVSNVFNLGLSPIAIISVIIVSICLWVLIGALIGLIIDKVKK